MKRDIPMPVVIGVVVVILGLVVGGGLWKTLKAPSQPPPATALNIAHGMPPPRPLSNAYHRPN